MTALPPTATVTTSSAPAPTVNLQTQVRVVPPTVNLATINPPPPPVTENTFIPQYIS